MNDFGYSINRDPDGTLVLSRVRLSTPNNGVSVGPTGGQFPVAQSLATGFMGNLQRLEAVCLATGATGGAWNIRDASGGAILAVLVQPKSPAPAGERIAWDFPTPVQTPQTAGFGNQMHVEVVGTNMGTWFFYANGYVTKVAQGGSTY
jgi:hypothetical protein